MIPAFTLAKKELREQLSSPVAYVFVVVFLCLSSWIYLSEVFLINQATLRPFFDWLPLLFIVFLPAITMSKWSDEIKFGTHEILFTLPVSNWQLIFGKFLSSLTLLLITLAFTLPLPLVISSLGELDWGPVWGSYLGILLLGMSYLALSLFFSSLTKSSIISFLVSVVFLFLVSILSEPLVTQYLPESWIPSAQFLSFPQHYQSLARGVVSFKEVVFFFCMTTVFLLATDANLKIKQKVL